MRRTLLASLTVATLVVPGAVGALAPVLSASAPAAAAGPTCDGQPATVLGAPGQQQLVGTSGPDVIVTNGAQRVYAGEGADLVCMTGGDTSVTLDGYDEDVRDGAWAADRVIGTGGDDVVLSGNYDDVTELRYDTQNLDEIVLGSGDSTVVMIGAPVGSLDGGTGRDRLVLQGSGSGRSVTLTIDAAGGEIGFTGHGPAALRSIESFRLDRSRYTDLVFAGTRAAETVDTHRSGGELSLSGPRRVTLGLGGGHDTVVLGDQDVAGTLTGGPGDDELQQVTYNENASVSYVRGRVRLRDLDGRATSFERVLVSSRSARVTGGPGPDRLTVRACTTTIEGRGGDDVVTVGTLPYCTTARHTVTGGRGADRLLAGRGRDTLIGGAGRDLVRGGAGVDRCVAETTRMCERS